MTLLIGTLVLTWMGNSLLAVTGEEVLLPGWAQLGIAGVFLTLFLTDRIVTGRKYDKVVAERDEERRRTERAEEKLETKVLPAMEKTQEAIRLVHEQMVPALKEVMRYLHESERAQTHRGTDDSG